jgi:hypothetical protein
MLRIERSGNGQVLFTLSGRIEEGEIQELQQVLALEKSGQHAVRTCAGLAGSKVANSVFRILRLRRNLDGHGYACMEARVRASSRGTHESFIGSGGSTRSKSPTA